MLAGRAPYRVQLAGDDMSHTIASTPCLSVRFNTEFGEGTNMYKTHGITLAGLLIAVLLTGSVAVQAETTSLSPGAVFRDCADCPELVVVPPGSFQMGSDHMEQMRDNELRPEGPVRSVVIAEPYAAGRFEITKADYTLFVDDTGHAPVDKCVSWAGRTPVDGVNWLDPSLGRPPAGNEPVVCVTWRDAKAYVAWLAEKTGQPYRLLTEAEWEFAAKAGSTAVWPWGEDATKVCEYGNVFEDSGLKEPRSTLNSNASATAAQCDDGYMMVAPVGQFRPNAFGLYDTIGNVWEWTEDCSPMLYADEPTDGSAYQVSGECEKRAVRSGSWRTRLSRHRTTFRGRDPEDLGYYMFGFRIARDLN